MFLSKILPCLILSSLFFQCKSQKQIRGIPEVDYPTYYAIPNTSFRCSDQFYNPGFYADTETSCQVFHYCYEHRQESFLCPMGTIFNQPILACDYWYSSNCSLAPSYYKVNDMTKKEIIFDEPEDPIDTQSDNLFDKMAQIYDVNNQTLDSPVFPENELSTVKNNKTEDYNKYSYDKNLNVIDEEQPEVVEYNVGGSNSVNHKGSENEIYETYNAKEFIFSEDGKLHPIQEDVYKMYPTDMNFNMGPSSYEDLPSKGNFVYDLTSNYDSDNDLQIPDFEFQKRHSDVNNNLVRRRPSSRKPIIVPEEEPEIVRLPVVKHKRRPTVTVLTTSTNQDGESSYETTYEPIISNQEAVMMANKGLEDIGSGEFPANEPNSNLKHRFSEPELYENHEDENGLLVHQMGTSRGSFDYFDEEDTRNMYVPSNIDEDEILANNFGSGHTDPLNIWNYDDEPEISTANIEGPFILPVESPDSIVDDGRSFDSNVFIGSGSEENFHLDSSDGSNFPEDQDIFSEGQDTEIINAESSYVLPMNISNNIEGSDFYDQKTHDGMPNYEEENEEPIQFVLKDFKSNSEYGIETSSESDNFGMLLPEEALESSGMEDFATDGNSESREFNYLSHGLRETSVNTKVEADQGIPEIREIDGSYYVYSDYNPDFEYDGSSGFYTENAEHIVSEELENSDKTPSLTDNEAYLHILESSELKMAEIDSKDSKYSKNIYETLSSESETESSSYIPEEGYIADDASKTLTTEDFKFLEIMSNSSIPMLKNLFEVSEKSNFDAEKEISRIEIVSPERVIDDEIPVDPVNVEVYESETFPGNGYDTAGNSVDIEILDTKQKSEDIVSNTDDSIQKVVLSEQISEVFAPGKKTDPINPIYTGKDEISHSPKSHELSLMVPSIKQKKVIAAIPITEPNLKIAVKGKRIRENTKTFSVPNNRNPLSPSPNIFRGARSTHLSPEFLKMKHSTLKPYFYNYGLKSSGFNTRTGSLFESSKLSKLTSFGKRLLEAKREKFNTMKKYINPY